MTFINLEHVDIKCPVCGNEFLVGANDEDLHGWPYLIHVPHAVHEESVEQSEFTCPFLLKPIPLDYTCPALKGDILKSYIGAGAMYNFVDDDKNVADANAASPVDLLRDSIKKYSRMSKLFGAGCNYCNNKYELRYKVSEETDQFSFRFYCDCVSSYDEPDLLRLAQDFMDKYDRIMPERNKRADFLNAVISRIPDGAVQEL